MIQHIFLFEDLFFTLTNSEDPYEMSHFVTFHDFFIWVFTVCKSTRLQRLRVYCIETTIEESYDNCCLPLFSSSILSLRQLRFMYCLL